MNITANNSVTTAKETRKLTTCIKNSNPEKRLSMASPTAVSAAVTTSDTNSMKPIASTMAKDKNRSRIMAQTP